MIVIEWLEAEDCCRGGKAPRALHPRNIHRRSQFTIWARTVPVLFTNAPHMVVVGVFIEIVLVPYSVSGSLLSVGRKNTCAKGIPTTMMENMHSPKVSMVGSGVLTTACETTGGPEIKSAYMILVLTEINRKHPYVKKKKKHPPYEMQIRAKYK